jgi:hypothetical protein
MKILFRTILIISTLAFASWGDSHDKLAKDQISWMEDITEVLSDVSAGDLSSSDAAVKIEALGESREVRG